MMVQKLFADATMALEDPHSVAVEGQRRVTPRTCSLRWRRTCGPGSWAWSPSCSTSP